MKRRDFLRMLLVGPAVLLLPPPSRVTMTANAGEMVTLTYGKEPRRQGLAYTDLVDLMEKCDMHVVESMPLDKWIKNR